MTRQASESGKPSMCITRSSAPRPPMTWEAEGLWAGAEPHLQLRYRQVRKRRLPRTRPATPPLLLDSMVTHTCTHTHTHTHTLSLSLSHSLTLSHTLSHSVTRSYTLSHRSAWKDRWTDWPIGECAEELQSPRPWHGKGREAS